jgi:hypothetical protein
MLSPIAREILDRMKRQGTTWDKEVARMKAKAPQDLLKDTENEMAATGAKPDQIASFEAAAKNITAEQLKSVMQSVVEPNTGGPAIEDVPEHAAVADLRDLAARLQSEAQQAVRASTVASTSSGTSATPSSGAKAKSESVLPKTPLVIVGVLVAIGACSFLVGLRGNKVRRGATRL